MCAMTVEQLEIVIDAKVDGALKGLKKTDKATKTFKDNALSMAKTFAGPLVALAIGKAAIDIGKKFSDMAAMAEEIESKFNVVFGDTATNVQAWADTYSDSVGRSKSDTIEFLASIGSLLKPLEFNKTAVDDLSKTVVVLANDLGSFNDMPTEAVMRDIQSAMIGNFEVTKKYGVVLNASIIKQEAFNRGIGDGKTELDAQTKAQIALELFIKGTSDAQGDLIATQDSYTNTTIRLESAQKDLGIAIGTNINTVFQPLLGLMAGITKEFANFVEESNNFKASQKALADGTADVNTKLQNEKELLSALREDLAGLKEDDPSSRAIEGFEKLIVVKEDLIALLALERTATEGQTKLERDAAKVALDASKIKQDAVTRLNELQLAALSSDDKRLIAIRKEINELWKYKDIAEVMDVINNLAAERTVIQKSQVIVDEEDFLAKAARVEAERAWAVAELIRLGDLKNAKKIANKEELDQIYDIQDARDEAAEAQAEADQKKLDDLQALQDQYVSYGKTISSFASGPLVQLGKALAKEEDGWKNFGKVAVLTLASIIKAFGDQAVVQSAIAFATGNVTVGLAYAAAAGTAYVTAGAVEQSASNFPIGGEFVTNGPKQITVGDNASGQEKVSITPVGGSGGGDESATILNIDGHQFRAWLNKEFENGKIRVPRRVLV